MIIYPCKELGCFFRLNGKVLEQAPMFEDGTCDYDNFGEREIDDDDEYMFQGKMRKIKGIEETIIGIITDMTNSQGAAL